MQHNDHKSAFISIVGKPNAGKSTLLNALLGEKFAIVSPKAQTTRHRIKGIYNTDDLQLVFSDTPGLLTPDYLLQEKMMDAVKESLEDADVILIVIDGGEKEPDELMLKLLAKHQAKSILLINKMDKYGDSWHEERLEDWKKSFNADVVLGVSALKSSGVSQIKSWLEKWAPVHPPFYDKEDLTDRSERFLVEEMIREKMLMNYSKEIPYAVEIKVESFKEEEHIIRIEAYIYTERQSQKRIIIGSGGEKLKKVGIEARADLEKFFGKQIYLKTFVKIRENWRKNEQFLKRFGYQ
jgi:GTP-binding protein Era